MKMDEIWIMIGKRNKGHVQKTTSAELRHWKMENKKKIIKLIEFII